MKRFDGKVVVITGGGSGMGKISCTLFAQEGASVCVVDINEKTAKATADEIIAAGGKAKAYDYFLLGTL
jgi:NAD(P)-dependent dehydrogenase (short-subunit alcohol dehydrogenase family)